MTLKALIFSLFLFTFTECQLPKEPLPDLLTNDTTPTGSETTDEEHDTDTTIAFKRNQNIGKGINFGNALEAPNEGEWGLTIKKSYIDSVATAGFNSVRIPICWSAHTNSVSPYLIESSFIARVDELISWCFENKLTVIITIHHFNEFYDAPLNTTYRAMFFAIWNQLSNHYKDTNHDKLIFEVLNEPHGNLTSDKWNTLIPEILKEIRDIDTNRTLIIDIPDWAYHGSISKLQIPENEQNVIVSVRYYLPYEFTHQGAHWVDGSDAWLGTTWTGNTTEKNTIISDLNFISDWAKHHHRPITVGEFGAIKEANHEQRKIWTRYVRSQFEANNFSWSYFDFGVIFKAYDIENDCWLEGFPEVFFD